MSVDLKQMKTLMLRLEAAVHRMEDVVEAQQTVQQGQAIRDAGSSQTSSETEAPKLTTPAASLEAPKEDSAAVKAYDDFTSTHLAPFLSSSNALGAPLADLSTLVEQVFTAQRSMIVLASSTKSPATDSPEYMEFLKPLQTQLMAVDQFKDKYRSSPFFNHICTVVDGIPALGWVAVAPAPAPFVGDMKDSAQFYANRVIKEYKDKGSKHVEWARSYITLLSELQKYVKSVHTTGLLWNAKGEDLSTSLTSSKSGASTQASKGTGAPPPPPPGPPPPPFTGDSAPTAASSAAPKSDMNSVFADLNRGSSVTAGLKKVDKSQMTHKNPALRDAPPVEAKRPVPSAKPAKLSKNPSYINTKKPARKELEGTKWFVENFEDDQAIVIDAIELHHSVYVYNCRNSTVQIKGKFNAISLDGCSKIGLVVDTLVSSIDLVKTKSFAIQVLDKCPTIICDVCESGQIYLAAAASDCEIVTSKCGSVNVNIDQGNGEFKEEAVPEMLKHKIVNGKLETEIVVHAD